jgi:hypothetical protein
VILFFQVVLMSKSLPSHLALRVIKLSLSDKSEEKQDVNPVNPSYFTDGQGLVSQVKEEPKKLATAETGLVSQSSAAAPSKGSSFSLATAAPSSAVHSQKSSKQVNGESSAVFSLADPLPNMGRSVMSDNTFTLTTTWLGEGFIATSETVPVYEAYYFPLSIYCPNYTSYTSCFDQYRCRQIEAWIVPRIGPSQISTTANAGFLVSAVDYDDAADWTSVFQGTQYHNSVVTPGVQGHYHKWRPRFALAAYGSGSFASYANEDCDTWIDCGYPSVQFYGLKTASEPTDVVYTYDLIVRSKWEFRNSR